MVELNDPVSVLEQICLQSMPIVGFDGVDYYMDLFGREFREVKRPRVCTPFESPIGQMIWRELRDSESCRDEAAEAQTSYTEVIQ